MIKKALTVSIIIPVYNEEGYIGKCLDAIAGQTVKPDEVIVVDNNSTDHTLDIVRKYDFVTVKKEKRQGRGAARSCGFNAASGDILARIDADSILALDWVSELHKAFSDSKTHGVTGLGVTNLLPFIEVIHSTLWSRVYFWSVHSWFGTITMWGANMAIRKQAWLEVCKEINIDDNLVHEDQDLSLALAVRGRKIVQDNNLRVHTKGQDYFYWPKFYKYVIRSVLTKRRYVGRIPNSVKINSWNLLFGAFLGITMTLIFGVVSFICWPLTYLRFRMSAEFLGKDAATVHRLK